MATPLHGTEIAKHQGREAALRGLPISSNPYASGTALRRAWLEGWATAPREQNNG